MSEYNEYCAERDKIDDLLAKGYRMTRITENLSGAFVDFEKVEGTKQEWEQLLITTAEGRKYFSSVLFRKGV